MFINDWYYLGYSYLTISAAISMNGSFTYVWNGRAYLSPNYGNALNNSYGGILGITTDYAYPSSGTTYMNPSWGFDGNGACYIYFSNSGFTSGTLYYKIYG